MARIIQNLRYITIHYFFTTINRLQNYCDENQQEHWYVQNKIEYTNTHDTHRKIYLSGMSFASNPLWRPFLGNGIS